MAGMAKNGVSLHSKLKKHPKTSKEHGTEEVFLCG
jgi:hypothetical protein